MAVFNISGNAGAASVLVSATGAASGAATSAADGIYTISGLIPGVYTITPTLAGATFTPASLSETIIAGNITDVNFVASPTGFSPLPIVSDNFTRANNVSLGANWTVGTSTNKPLAILSDRAVGDAVGAFGFDIYTGSTFAHNQQASVTIDLFSTASEIDLAVRTDVTNVTGYLAELVTDTGVSTVSIVDVAALSAIIGIPFTLAGSPASGDILTIQAVGTLVTVFYNGVPVTSATSSTTASGIPGLAITSTATQSDTSASLFTAGQTALSISGSVGVSGAGATVALSGAASATTTADGSGNYSFAGLGEGTYQVTPGLAGKAFSPSQQIVVVTSANVTGVNFTLFTPSKSGSRSGSIAAAGPRFDTAMFSPNTSIIGTKSRTKILN